MLTRFRVRTTDGKLHELAEEGPRDRRTLEERCRFQSRWRPPARRDREIAEPECEPRYKLPTTRVEDVAYLGNEISSPPLVVRADRCPQDRRCNLEDGMRQELPRAGTRRRRVPQAVHRAPLAPCRHDGRPEPALIRRQQQLLRAHGPLQADTAAHHRQLHDDFD